MGLAVLGWFVCVGMYGFAMGLYVRVWYGLLSIG